MVQQGFPLLILWTAPETHRVVFQSLPAHQQNILAVLLQTFLQPVGEVPFHARDDALGLFKSLLEFRLFAGNHVQNGHFKDHGVILKGLMDSCEEKSGPGRVYSQQFTVDSKHVLQTHGTGHVGVF